MQQFTQKYAIIQLFEAVPEGARFPSSNWPLHSTIVDTFAIGWSVSTIIKELTELLSNHQQASTTVSEDKFFGPKKQTQVVLLKKTDDLVKLHYDVVELLQKGGLTLNDPQFSRGGFLPHATVQKHARLNKGDIVTFDALSIIDMFPGGDAYERKFLKTIRIDSQAKT